MFVGTSILIVMIFCAIFLLICFIYECAFAKKLSDKINGFQLICILTALWVLLTIILASNEKESLALNNWGDYLAGFVSPLLFVWLVYGVLIQKEEFKNALLSLSFQQIELTNSVQTMKEQVIQIEIQQLNTWLARNLSTINLLKESLVKNIQVKNVDSIALINLMLQKNFIEQESSFFNIFDELKSILDIHLYMIDYLEKIKDKKQGNSIYLTSIDDIEQELATLLGSDIQHIKEIITMVYFFIVVSKTKTEDKYKKYQIYSHWLHNDTDIMNFIVNNYKETYEQTMEEIRLLS